MKCSPFHREFYSAPQVPSMMLSGEQILKKLDCSKYSYYQSIYHFVRIMLIFSRLISVPPLKVERGWVGCHGTTVPWHFLSPESLKK